MAVNRSVLGIDLGTSNTSAAWMDARARLSVVQVQGVDNLMPSVVWQGADGRVLVGQDARQKMIEDPANTIYGLKRFLGRLFRSEFVGRHRDVLPFKLVEDEEGLCGVELHGKVRRLQDLASDLLRHIVGLANIQAGAAFTDAVLTVPAHYGYRQRQAMRAAAQTVGLNVRALVNEPTAAALAYMKQKDAGQRVLVFDLGGGTFDATLIAIEGHIVRVLATGGDAFLGGADFDDRIAQALAERFERENGVALRQDRLVMRRLGFASEMAKIILSSEEETRVRVVFAAIKGSRALDLEYVLRRDAMETMIAPLIERALGACEDLIRKANMKASDVNEVLMVGGQTRTPALRRRLLNVYRSNPNNTLHPELCVCAGAAMLGRGLTMPAGAGLMDAVSMPIWMALPGGNSQVLFPANTAVPHQVRVKIAERPATPGAPLVLALYEALDATSVEREIVGTIRVDPGWLAHNPGAFHIEARLMESFALEVAAVPQSGPAEPLRLEAPLVHRTGGGRV